VSAQAFVHAEKANYSVKLLCSVAQISRSSYYDWTQNHQSELARTDALLLCEIRDIYETGRGNYGSPRIHDELKKQGRCVGRKRVIRLMRSAQICAKTKRKFRVTTDSNHDGPFAENVLARAFTSSAPDRVWVSDITYLKTKQGWLYLCVVIDLFSRKIVGWSLQKRMPAELVCDAFDMAVRLRRPGPGLVFHSDRGSQYCSKKLLRRFSRWGTTRSMSRKGNCWDNAVSESFFATLKKELVRGKEYATDAEAQSEVFEYITVFYNRVRKHSVTNGVSPESFESCKSLRLAA
jgi:putative transposase